MVQNDFFSWVFKSESVFLRLFWTFEIASLRVFFFFPPALFSLINHSWIPCYYQPERRTSVSLIKSRLLLLCQWELRVCVSQRVISLISFSFIVSEVSSKPFVLFENSDRVELALFFTQKSIFFSHSWIVSKSVFLFWRSCSTSWTQPSCTASRREKESSCLDRPTPRETTLKASLVSSSQRYHMHFLSLLFNISLPIQSSLLTCFFSLHSSLWFHYLVHFLSPLSISPAHLHPLSHPQPHPTYSHSASLKSWSFHSCHSLSVSSHTLLLRVCLSITFHSWGLAIIPGVNVAVWPS